MKQFERRQLREAIAYAAAGGQALHLTVCRRGPWCFRRSAEMGHLFDRDAGRLVATAGSLGVRRIVIDREGTDRQHVDLCGRPLAEAKRIAENERIDALRAELWRICDAMPCGADRRGLTFCLCVGPWDSEYLAELLETMRTDYPTAAKTPEATSGG